MASSEHAAKYEALAKTLGEDSLRGLVQDLVPRVRAALANGDEHLNKIPLAVWDRRAGMLGIRMSWQTSFRSELRSTARDPALPWHRAPKLSLAERVCVLKHVARKLAEEVAP